MTRSTRRLTAGWAAGVATAALLLTGCAGQGGTAPKPAPPATTATPGDGQLAAMQHALDAADSAAAQADQNATQDN